MKRIPKYQIIEKDLIKHIASSGLKPHDLFFSEREVSTKFSVSPLTARKIFDDLEEQGFLYRIHGKGTFIAPKRKRSKIIVVLDISDSFNSFKFDRVEFYIGALAYAAGHAEYDVIMLKENELMPVIRDLEHLYPGVTGVVFFRTLDLVFEAAPHLKGMDIPFIFYGSDTHKARLDDHNYLLYNEADITSTALEHLYARGHRAIGIVYIPKSGSGRRYELYRTWMTEKGLAVRDDHVFRTDNFYFALYPLLEKASEKSLRSMTALFCTTDAFASDAVQFFMHKGYRIPEDIAVLGIDNSPFCTIVRPNITSISIPLQDDAAACVAALIDVVEGRQEVIKRRSSISLIARETT